MAEESFPLGAIPERLKCALCTALARDAWKLSCCDQITCGSCFAALREDACPICAFTPMEKDKSTPSTSLRTTIAVFLRHAEKRYNDALAKEARHTSKPITKTDESGSMLNRNAHNAMDQVSISSIQELTSSVGQSHSAGNSLLDTPTNNPSSGPPDQQHGLYEEAYSSNQMMPSNMAMPFPMLNSTVPHKFPASTNKVDFTMAPINPLLMQQMAMAGGYGGFGDNGWNANMMQNYSPNMNMHVQESNFPDFAPPSGPAMFEYSNRGSSRGRFISRGVSSSYRGGRGGYSAATGSFPVVVEGAPTGPSAMRNNSDSRGRSARGRGVLSREAIVNQGLSRDDSGQEVPDGSTGKQTADHSIDEVHRGRSMSRSVTRERTLSPRKRSFSRSRPSHTIRAHRSEEQEENARPIDDHRKRRPIPEDFDEAYSAKPVESIVVSKALIDRIDKAPRSRSRSPKSSRRRDRRSPNRGRRNRSGSRARRHRSRSRSRDRRHKGKRSHSVDHDKDKTRRHKRDHKTPDASREGEKRGKRHRSQERDSKRSSNRRSNPKHEAGSPELRRLENERENSRYR